MSRRTLSVAIVGGGIAGTAAALALRSRGVDAQVFERSPVLGEVGAGVFMTPNSTRVLRSLGVGERLAELGAAIGEGSTYYRRDGTPVAPMVTRGSTGREGSSGMHRADLLDLLSERLPEDSVHVGRECTGLRHEGSSVVLTFADGTQVSTDVVIGADGIRSRVRQILFGSDHAVHSGSVAYRGLLEATDVPGWTANVSQLWMGEGKHFLVYPVRSGRLLNYVGFVPSERRLTESWSAPGDPDRLRADFAGWDPRIGDLLSAVETTYGWGLYDREPLTRWTVGRVTLMGDAAHPMLPHLGQGANQAIEDASALASALTDAAPEEIPHRLLAYEALRQPRTAQVQAGARANGRRYDSAYESLDERDAEIAASAEFRLWLYDYDVLDEAGSAWARS